jgi:YbgC/YbaW family acyl-CoA thioester hydrolase
MTADDIRPDTFRHRERLRVRWAEVDMQQIVFNGHYLMYFDTAVAGWWRAMAVPYQATMAALQGDLYVRKATLEYWGSARYDDLCEVGVRCVHLGNSSMRLQAALLRDGRALVGGELVYVFADPAMQTSRPLPQPLRDLVSAFEAGEPMWSVRVGGWTEAAAPVRALRRAVAGPSTHVDESADAGARHAVAVNRLGHPVGCARRRLADPGADPPAPDARATWPGLRGVGIGRSLVDALA